MASIAALKRDVARLRQEVAARTAPPPAVVFIIPNDCPLPRFDKAATLLAAKWPETTIVEMGFSSAEEVATPLAQPSRDARGAADLAALDRALAEDVAAWLGSDAHKAQVAADVAAHLDMARTSGQPCWREALEEDRERCARWGVPFPAEAPALLALPPPPVPPPPRLALPAPPAPYLRAAERTLEVRAAPCAVCSKRHPPGLAVFCAACSCHALHHESVAQHTPCRHCGYDAPAHLDPRAGFIRFGAKVQQNACGSFAVDGPDACLCRACPGFRLEVGS